jgi:hypothetical protein
MQNNKYLIQSLNNYQIKTLLNFKFIIISEKLFFSKRNKKSLNITLKKSVIKDTLNSISLTLKYPCFLTYSFEYNYFLSCFENYNCTNFLVKVFNKIIYKPFILNNFFFDPYYKNFNFIILTTLTSYNLIIVISLFLQKNKLFLKM